MSEMRPNAHRYRVAEVEGFLNPGGGKRAGTAFPGLTVAVLDSANAWREMARFRTEDQPRFSGRAAARESVRWLGRAEARRLNARDAAL